MTQCVLGDEGSNGGPTQCQTKIESDCSIKNLFNFGTDIKTGLIVAQIINPVSNKKNCKSQRGLLTAKNCHFQIGLIFIIEVALMRAL